MSRRSADADGKDGRTSCDLGESAEMPKTW